MATTLYLRNLTSEITDTGDTLCYRLINIAGAASDTGVVNTAASGTNIQWTKTAGGSTMAWISGKVPAGGFTLTSVNVSAWLEESNNAANAKGRIHIYKYTPGTPTITELGASPVDTASELGSSGPAEITWTANITDTAFAQNDRILVKFYITNNGTMGGSRTCTITFNAADAATGDSFVTLAETVTFTPRDYPFVCAAGSLALSGVALATKAAHVLVLGAGSYTLSGSDVSPLRTRIMALAAGSLALSIADTITVDRGLGLDVGAYTVSGIDVTLSRTVSSTYTFLLGAGSCILSGVSMTTAAQRKVAPVAGSYALSGVSSAPMCQRKLPLSVGAYTLSGSDMWSVAGGETAAPFIHHRQTILRQALRR